MELENILLVTKYSCTNNKITSPIKHNIVKNIYNFFLEILIHYQLPYQLASAVVIVS